MQVARIDFGKAVLPGGYFLVDPARPKLVEEAESDTTAAACAYRHCFTAPGSTSSIHEAALQLIRAARRKLFVASFRLGDGPLLDALFDAARRLRGGVYVVTQLDDRSLERGIADLEREREMAELEDEDEPGAFLQAQHKCFAELTSRGIYVRGAANCHAKFLIADDAAALVSSANLETRAFEVTSESGCVVTDPAEVARLARFFGRLWYARCELEVPPGASYTVRARAAEAAPAPVPPPPPAATGRPGVIWTDDGETHIAAAVRDIVDRAACDVLLATYSLGGLAEHPEILLDPVARAVRRGVRVRVLVRARNHMTAGLRDCAALASAGAELRGGRVNHHKGALADGRTGALFSANFEPDRGLLRGVEVGLRLDGLPALDAARRFFEHEYAAAPCAFAVSPTAGDADHAFAARWRAPWPLGRRVAVEARANEWALLAHAAGEGPVLFRRDEQQGVRLLTGSHAFRIIRGGTGGAFTIRAVERSPDEAAPNALMLFQRWRSAPPRRPPATAGAWDERGFCSAVFDRVGGVA